MIPKNKISTHPGAILLNEFLEPLGVTQISFANHINVSVQRVNEIIKGKRGISPDTAWLFSQALNTTPEFWLNLQATYDLSKNRPRKTIKQLVAAES